MSHLSVNRVLTSMDILGNNIGAEQAQKLIELLDTSATLKTLCGFTGEEVELDLSKRSLSASCAVLVANEIKVNRALTSIKINDYALPVNDIKTKPVLDLSNKKLKVEDAIIVAALLPLNEYV